MTELTLQQLNRIIEEVLLAARQRDMPPLAVAAVGAAGGVSQDDEACVQAAITAAGFSF